MMKIGAIAALAFATCAWLFEPAPPPGEQMTPPEHFRAIWDSAQACTNTHGDFNRVTWYQVAGNSFSGDAGPAIGTWYPPHSIAIAREWLTTDWVVKHEMIHDLLQDGHTEEERKRIWGRQCHATWGYQPIDSSYVP
jgi:hypothetical protein